MRNAHPSPTDDIRSGVQGGWASVQRRCPARGPSYGRASLALARDNEIAGDGEIIVAVIIRSLSIGFCSEVAR